MMMVIIMEIFVSKVRRLVKICTMMKHRRTHIILKVREKESKEVNKEILNVVIIKRK